MDDPHKPKFMHMIARGFINDSILLKLRLCFSTHNLAPTPSQKARENKSNISGMFFTLNNSDESFSW